MIRHGWNERQETGGAGRPNRGWAILQAMRNGQNKRMRGRNRKSHNPLTRVYESNGPDVKIRGTASHIAEKFVQLARDAQSSGDPIAAENYFQHAEHYFRLIASAQEQFRPNTPFMRGEGGADTRDDFGDDGEDEQTGPMGAAEQPSFGTRDPQPYLPRDAQFYSPREQQNFSRDQQNFSREQQNSSRDQQSFAREPQNTSRDQQNFSREPQNYPREQQNYPREQPGQGRHNQHQPQHTPQHAPVGGEDDGNVERLPSFITGGAAAPAAPPPQAHQSNGQNGFEGQGDRFPLHRRRRRHRAPPRGDVPPGGSGASEGGDSPPAPRPAGD
jgi:hypothetical protein